MNLRTLIVPAVGLVALAGTLLVGRKAQAAPAGQRFGPYHKDRRPPGLPSWVAVARSGKRSARGDGHTRAEAIEWARAAFRWRFKADATAVSARPVAQPSAVGGALPAVEAYARREGRGPAFVRTMLQLARGEGEGGTHAVPARNFDARYVGKAQHALRRLAVAIDGVRRPGRSLITAWGAFQWNRDAGREADSLEDLGVDGPGLPADWMPWDWSHADELRIPIAHYARLWRRLKAAGATDIDAARGVRLWHTGPSRYRRYLVAGPGRRSWAAQPAAVTGRIDHHLRAAGVLT